MLAKYFVQKEQHAKLRSKEADKSCRKEQLSKQLEYLKANQLELAGAMVENDVVGVCSTSVGHDVFIAQLDEAQKRLREICVLVSYECCILM